MTRDEQNNLEKRREALRQEISTVTEAITDIVSPPYNGPDRRDQLNNLRTVLATRERELHDVEQRLASTAP
jgi:hypothetical protein